MSPERSTRKPDPVAVLRLLLGEQVERVLHLADEVRPDENDSRRVALIDRVGGEPRAGARRLRRGDRGLLDDRLSAPATCDPEAEESSRDDEPAGHGGCEGGTQRSSHVQDQCGWSSEVELELAPVWVRARQAVSMSAERISASPTSTASDPGAAQLVEL